ncbi:DNA helicase B [Pelodytes ibericus]
MSTAWSRHRDYRIQRTRTDYQVLQGQLLPEKNEPGAHGDADGDGEEEEIENEDPQFLDADQIDGGGVVLNAWSPRKVKVIIRDENGQKYHVIGFFPLLEPWWYVTVEVKGVKSQYFTGGHPSYEIQNDVFENGNVLAIFLTACNVADEVKQEFINWLPKDTQVTFRNLPQVIEEFEIEKNCDTRIMSSVQNSDVGRITMNALDAPLVFKYLPKLLPRHVKSLMMMERKQDIEQKVLSDKLQKIQTILHSEPWKLGFDLIVNRELNIYHCEASWENFLTCEPLLEKISELHKNSLIIYNELKKKCNELGDTYIEQKTLTRAVSGSMPANLAWDALGFLKDNDIVVLERERVFLHNLYRYEREIAQYIHTLVTKKSWLLDMDTEELLGAVRFQSAENATPGTSSIDKSQLSSNIDNECLSTLQISNSVTVTENCDPTILDIDQKQAVKMICSNPVTVISGKGGCGKTTIVSLVFKSLMRKETDEIEKACKALESDMDASDEWKCDNVPYQRKYDDPIRILLTAPTGKAASLLKKKTDLPAATLHQVTYSYSCWKKPHSDSPQKKEWKFSRVEVLVVDEGSLVSVHILSTALRLLSDYGKLAKLVILGDVRQLPSIQPGNLLTDVFTVLDKMKWAIELRRNHRAESQLIVDNATRISQQNSITYDAVIDLSGGENTVMPTEDKKFIFVALPDKSDHELQNAILKLLKKGPGLEDDKCSQFIAFRRSDCMLINELCSKHYSGHSIKTHKNKYDFQCKDKVCCTKNAYLKDLLPRKSTSDNNESKISTDLYKPIENGNLNTGINESCSETPATKELNDDERLCNGEIFFIIHDVERNKIRDLTISDEDREFTLSYDALRSRSGLRHAWARTIHTFQGSEEDTVVYVLGPSGRQNWKHIYTAVTRGRKRVYVVAKSDQLNQAIANKARERKTRLQQRLNELFAKSRDILNPNGSHPTTRVSETQLPYTIIKADSDLKDNQDLNGIASSQPQSPARAVVQTGTNTMEFPDMEQSPSNKRAAISPGDPGTPSKICRRETSEVGISPTAVVGIRNLNIASPCHKQLFKS